MYDLILGLCGLVAVLFLIEIFLGGPITTMIWMMIGSGKDKVNEKFNCPCCGYPTIRTDHEICPICRWENDLYQLENPDEISGANNISLRQAQEKFNETIHSDAGKSDINKVLRELGLENIKPKPASI